MYSKDKSDNLSKEGSGRVALFKQFKINICYTVESSYNMGNILNRMYPRSNNYEISNDNQETKYDPEFVTNNLDLNPLPMMEHYTIDHLENIGEVSLFILWININLILINKYDLGYFRFLFRCK